MNDDERQGSDAWRCPSCGSVNPPGSDSCQVCGRHLHVPESIGRKRSRSRADPLRFTRGLVGFAVPLAGLVLGNLVAPLAGTIGSAAAFVLVQVAALLPRWGRTRPEFLIGWVLGLALAVWSVVRSGWGP